MTSYQRTFVSTVGLLIVAFATSSVRAQTPPGIVQYFTEVGESATTALVSDIVAGNQYTLTTYVQDITPGGSGVFSAFVDVQYDPMNVQLTGPIQHGSTYSNGTNGSTATPGLIEAVGGVDGLTPTGVNSFEVFSIAFQALNSGPVDFQLSAPLDQAHHATTRYFSNFETPVECIDFGTGQTNFPAACTVPEPTSMGLLYAAFIAICPLLRRRRK